MTELIENYPNISQEDVLATLAFAADGIRLKPFVKVDDISDDISEGK